MRVLHLTTEFPPVIYGGLGTAVGGLVTASVRAGLTVGVLLIGDSGRSGYSEPPLETQVTARKIGAAPGDVAFVTLPWSGVTDAAVQVVRAWQPDLVHLHAFWLWPIAHAIRAATGTPVVYTVHSLDRAEYELGQGPPECLTQWDIQATAIATADRVIALTESERHLLQGYCPGVAARVRVVGNGIDDALPVRRATEVQRATDAPLVLFTGRFVERKGVGEFLAAIPAILQQAPRTRFVLAGGHRHCTGDEMAAHWLPPGLRAYRDQIHFTGWLTPDAVGRWYQAADVLVVPSWYEPFGMVILEGMLHGVPIAAAAVGGPAEILEHERTGLLFRPRDAHALADTVIRLVTDTPLRSQLGTAAAAEVRRMWLWPQIVTRMQQVYGEAVLQAA